MQNQERKPTMGVNPKLKMTIITQEKYKNIWKFDNKSRKLKI